MSKNNSKNGASATIQKDSPTPLPSRIITGELFEAIKNYIGFGSVAKSMAFVEVQSLLVRFESSPEANALNKKELSI